MRIPFIALLIAVALPGQDRDRDRNPLAGQPAAIAKGGEIFRGACSACHGMSGNGGTGPSLVRGLQVRRANDRQMFQSIRGGVRGTDMPPFPNFKDDELWSLVAFVRSLSAPAIRAQLPGDAAKGRELFQGAAGCAKCHAVHGSGGVLGPDLSDAGQRTVQQLEEAIYKPSERIEAGFAGITAHMKDGRKLEGVAKNWNNYSVQISDSRGALHMLWRKDISRLEHARESLMPADYEQRLTGAQRADLLAYLARLNLREAASKAKPAPVGVTEAEIRQSPNRDWLTYSGDYASTRHSPLKQITASNVPSLVAKWVHKVEGARRLAVSPIVYQGVMYVTDSNYVIALDARTGRKIWQHRAESKPARVNRGVAIHGDKVFLVTSDCHAIALNRLTGAVQWVHEYASNAKGYQTSIAPLAVKDKILVGVAGGGSGQRGFVAALNVHDGSEAWRFWTVPAKGEPGSETWGGFPTEWSGAPTWTTGSFDPDLNIVYWATGNPWPDFHGGDRKGDNLYSDSVVALDADTGKMKWYFQFTPHDVWDWDANEPLVLIDTEWKGRPRKLLLQANRNGYYYVLDRATGEYLHGTPFIERLNWAKGLDAKGRPILVPGMEPTTGGKRICPSVRGATNWNSPSYNPATGLLYVVTLEQCDVYTTSAKDPVPSTGFRGTGGEQIPTEPGAFYLRALDAKSGAIKWQYRMPGPATMWAGTVSTAGGLVFTGDDDGNLVALDAKTGADLWHFPTGQTLYASPVTFEVEGKQYVTIAAESDVFTFGLFGK